MPSMPCESSAYTIGRGANPFAACILPVPVPIVPITYIDIDHVIGNKGSTGTDKRVYARKEFELLGHRHGHKERNMREKQTEQKLVRAVKDSGGIAVKFVSPGFDGMPDRLLLMPGGKAAFVEVKAVGMNPRPLQIRRHGLLRRLGFPVYVLDDEAEIGGLLDEIRTT